MSLTDTFLHWISGRSVALTAFTIPFIGFLVALLGRGQSKKSHLPPGPKPLPLVGNMFDMSPVQPWKQYAQWTEKYGNIVYLNLPFQPTIILGSIKASIDLLEKRSNLYSDRNRIVMYELMSWDFHFAFLPYGSKWRTSRRSFHQYFNQNATTQYRSIQVQQNRLFLRRVLQRQNVDLRKLTRLLTAATVYKIVYGIELEDMNDENLQLAEMSMKGLALGLIPGAYWVEYFPFLRHIPTWFPGAGFRRIAEAYRPYVKGMLEKPYASVLRAMGNGTALPSVAQSIVLKTQSGDQGALPESLHKDVLAVAYGAASDTSTASTEFFLLAMAKYPEVQRKAQAELDALVGPNRLPDFSDYDDLVYCRAIVKETFRWRPVVPFGVVHRVMCDDEYEGFLIPEGTTILYNSWGMLHNPDDYPHPEVFNPERYIKDGKLDTTVRDPGSIAFGFGRRICPGRYLADTSLFMTVASVLHSFNVEAAKGSDGKPLSVDVEMTSGMISSPESLPCVLRVRSTQAENLIHKSEIE